MTLRRFTRLEIREPSTRSAKTPLIMTAPDQPPVLGHHWILDLQGCPESLLDDEDGLRERLTDVTAKFGFSLLKIASHRFSPQGVTAIGLLAESHLSIHTWPEFGFAAVDVMTCGSPEHLDAACEHIFKALQAESKSIMRLSRGVQRADGTRHIQQA